MPSQRKRIGFLPTKEVQDIINKICASENISQSKVTGILVNEALKSRLLNNNLEKEKKENLNKIDDEFYLVREFLEYKKFKVMLKKAILEEKK